MMLFYCCYRSRFHLWLGHHVTGSNRHLWAVPWSQEPQNQMYHVKQNSSRGELTIYLNNRWSTINLTHTILYSSSQLAHFLNPALEVLKPLNELRCCSLFTLSSCLLMHKCKLTICAFFCCFFFLDKVWEKIKKKVSPEAFTAFESKQLFSDCKLIIFLNLILFIVWIVSIFSVFHWCLWHARLL